jgi:hypothetical protein
MKAMMQTAAAKSVVFECVWVSVLCASLLFACTADQEVKCGEGTELVAGRCVPSGGDSSVPGDGDGDGDGDGVTCGDGAVVFDGVCQGKRPIGAPCESGEQCLSDSCLGADRGAQDGYCTTPACSANRPCEAGSHCYYSQTERSFLCLVYCDGEDDCRDGYACQPLYTSDVSVCAPSCVATQACPAGTLCNGDSGKCELHECVLGSSEPCATDEDAGTTAGDDLVCYADRLGLSETGAVCLPSCDPSAPTAQCASNEVCQPLPEDPANMGLCVPPLCAAKEDCSAGAVCMNGVCQPPARCDEDGECAGDGVYVCVGGAGGQCMPRCPESGDEGCAALHPGLSCSAALDACLPTGAFPGSVCRSELSSPCDPLSVGGGATTPMVCENGTCLASCAEGGSDLCEGISSTLTCAQDVFDQPLCLPNGSFPGGPCGAGDACAPLQQGGNTIPMVCADDKCIITCDDAAGGDQLCDAIDASLVCIADAFETTQDMCLPRGAYPGGPCGAGDTCGSGMTCEDNRCLYECGSEMFCTDISPILSCAVGVYDVPVCLPLGTFPGSPCRPTVGDECDQNLSGLDQADMVCASNKCVVQCEAPGPFTSGDVLCGFVSPALTCLANPAGVDVCVTACGESNACPAGLSCLVSQDACLPTGSFLGSPCASGMCDGAGTPPLACAPSMNSCAAACSSLSAAGGSAYCQGVAANFGQSWDTCVDADGPGDGTALICVDGTPP